MITRKSRSKTSTLYGFLLLLPSAKCHMDLSDSDLMSLSPAQTNSQNAPSIYASPPTLSTNRRQASVSTLESYSTTTVTLDCQTTVTLTTMPSYYFTAAPSLACTGTSASCPCAANYQCLELSPCLWGCEARPLTTARTSNPKHSAHPTSRSTRILTSTHTVIPVRPTSSAQPPAGTSGSHPPYAGADVQPYLPCVPGTFICVDRTTWDTCDYNASGQWVYNYPRKVAAGMECITFLSPNSGGTSQHGQQGLTPQGYHRDDRVVRARPDGDCSQNGAIKCTQNGQMFEVCDQGGWVNMGSVAAGTRCENGKIV